MDKSRLIQDLAHGTMGLASQTCRRAGSRVDRRLGLLLSSGPSAGGTRLTHSPRRLSLTPRLLTVSADQSTKYLPSSLPLGGCPAQQLLECVHRGPVQTQKVRRHPAGNQLT